MHDGFESWGYVNLESTGKYLATHPEISVPIFGGDKFPPSQEAMFSHCVVIVICGCYIVRTHILLPLKNYCRS